MKNPLGIKPEWHWLEERVFALSEAMQRYSAASMDIPAEWIDELSRHTEWIRENRRKV